MATPRGGSLREQAGATSAEYAILIGLIALLIIAGVAALGRTLTEAYCEPIPTLSGGAEDC
jgi:Flp pilus assembly pilin Flp